jgi:hypothetical protein
VSRSPRPVPPLHLALGLACVIVAAAASACGDTSRTPAAADLSGLVLLTVEGEQTRVTTFDAAGAPHTQPGPGGPVAWLSAGRRGTAVATMPDGTLRLSDPVRTDGDAKWKKVPSARADLPDEPMFFATWAPNGNRIAALATQFDQAAPLSLVVVDPIADTSLIRVLAGRALAAPPAWLDDSRLLVETTADTIVVGVDSGEITAGPATGAGAALVDVSADGSRVAVGRGDPGSVEIRARDPWLGGGGQPETSISGDGTVGAVALDRRADRLAVIWQRGSNPGLVVVYRRDRGWQESSRLPLPNGSRRGVVTWLP